MNEVGQAVREARLRKGWKSYELAWYAGVAPSAISQLENGRRGANIKTLIKISRALEIRLSVLLEGVE